MCCRELLSGSRISCHAEGRATKAERPPSRPPVAAEGQIVAVLVVRHGSKLDSGKFTPLLWRDHRPPPRCNAGFAAAFRPVTTISLAVVEQDAALPSITSAEGVVGDGGGSPGAGTSREVRSKLRHWPGLWPRR